MRQENNLKKILDKLSWFEKNDGKFIHLTANESVMSPLAIKWLGSILNTRYILGSLEERNKQDYYFFKKCFLVRGIPDFNELELLAKKACQKMFHCQESDFSPLSGLHAMTALIGALTSPGDLVMSLPFQYCGHYATGPMLKSMGREQIILPYNPGKFEIDLGKLKQLAQQKRVKEKVRMIYLDTMHYFSPYPLKKIKETFPRAVVVYDASHVLGLVAGGRFQDPLLEGADVLSGNTHKTLPGPQKAIILYKDKELSEKALMVSEIFTSSRHTHSSISLFITLLEMMNFGRDYANQIIRNTQALADSLCQNGFKLLAYPGIKPETHQILIHIDSVKNSSKLIRAGISVNALPLFNGLNFLRLGTQQVTRLGMKESEMQNIAYFIADVLKKNRISQTRKEVEKMMKKFRKIHYCFE